MTNPPLPHAETPFARLMQRPYLILVLTSLFWGGNVVAGKLAVGHIDPYMLMIFRWTGAVLVALPFGIRQLQRDWPIVAKSWPLLLFYGALGFTVFNVFVYLAAYLTFGVNIAIEQVAVNIFVMALNFAIFRTAVKPLQLVGVALTILGVAITATHGDLARILTLDVNLGDAFVLIACFAYAIYSLTLRWRPKTGWLSFLVVTCVGAALSSLIFQLIFGGGIEAFVRHLPEITPQGWAIVAYTVVFPSVLSQMFYVRGVELIGANRASLFVNLIPLFGTLGSVLVLGERLEASHLTAAALVAVGIVLAEFAARRA